MRLLVVQHQDSCPLGWFAEWLTAGGVKPEIVRPYAGEALPDRLDGYAGLLVLGGSMGAYDDESYGWLVGVKALLRTAVQVEAPTLGICLGHQLLAAACGGRVEPNPAGRTMGVVKVNLTSDGAADPLVGTNSVDVGAPQLITARWNQDIVVAPPAAAELLAVDDAGVTQAIRVGDRAWGVQFHPEASPSLVAKWAATTETGYGADGLPTRDQVAAALSAVRDSESDLARTGRAVAQAFARALNGNP